MPDFPARPDWLEARALNDAAFADAYDALGAEGRARLKHCIAVQHAFWGERAACRRETRDFRQGFRVEAEEEPAPYALVFCDADYDRPDLLLATLMPAILAGCPLVLPCFLPAEDRPAASLLAALELAGVEDAYGLDEGEGLRLFDSLHESVGLGRVVILGRAAWADAVILHAVRRDVPCRLISSGAAGFTAETGFEHVSILPDLPPEWFCRRRLRLSAYQKD